MKFPFRMIRCYLYICITISFHIISCKLPESSYKKTVSESILNITFDSETENAFITDDNIIKAAFDGMLSTLNEPTFHTRCLNKPEMNKSFRDSISQYKSFIINELSISLNSKKSTQHNINTCKSSKQSAYKTAHNHVKSLKSKILSLRNDIKHYLPSRKYWPLKLQFKYDIKQKQLEDYEAELVDYLDMEYTIKIFNCTNWANGGEGVITTVYRKMMLLNRVYATLLFCLSNNNKYYYNLVHDSGLMTKSFLPIIPKVFVSVYSTEFKFLALPVMVMTKGVMKPPNEDVVVRLMNTDVYLKSLRGDDEKEVEDCRRTLAFYLGKIMGCYGNVMIKRYVDMYTEQGKIEWH